MLTIVYIHKIQLIGLMPKAYVLISGKLGLEKELVSKLKTIENVKEVHGTLGTFDFIAKVEADSEEHVNQTILEKIRKMGNVSSTITLMTVEDTDFFVADSNKLMIQFQSDNTIEKKIQTISYFYEVNGIVLDSNMIYNKVFDPSTV